ncbi:MAG: hypothetical protein R3249_09790 [Nitriliruptorales bacterium]|nr:hypothetical protein [Nitriliruptorales bacterium]
MTPTRNRRLLSVGAAIALALGGSAVAFAGPDGGQDEPGESGEVGTDSLVTTAEQEGEGQAENGEGGENATAFSAWVRELPKLGCIRGQLVSSAARGDHRGDFEAPEFDSEEGMLDELELTERRCAEVALSKAAEAEEGGEELSGEAEGNGHGKPAHAKGPKKDKPAKPDKGNGEDDD